MATNVSECIFQPQAEKAQQRNQVQFAGEKREVVVLKRGECPTADHIDIAVTCELLELLLYGLCFIGRCLGAILLGCLEALADC